MTAPVSPIATQETPVAADLLAFMRDATALLQASGANNAVYPMWNVLREFCELRAGQLTHHAELDRLRTALSSAERRIEELVRERDEARACLDDGYGVNVGLAHHRATEAEAPVTTLKAEVEELKRRPDMLKQLLDDANAAHFDATMRADAAESRLASPTGQVEDAASEKVVAWMIQHSIATGHGDTLDDLLGELSAYVRKMQAEIERLSNRFQRATEDLAELRVALASLTGQVEDMRAAGGHAIDTLQAFLDTFGDLGDRVTHADIEDWRAAFSLPVLPTTGDGGGARVLDAQERDAFGRALLRSVEVVGHLAPTGRETSGEET